ncbi:3-oxoadipate enol-lactone hydrolase [Cnuibacter physcomitrellae]|uniref:Uncharacterized protein n=1 Tax=Cnuibacter physcomitrellae TaxID=1619308 RepID=A0A1X9LRG4_9MICO|nr:alpha/beta hydrolase [Cnuibacter physcomitrellae]ARJ06918.1 hypothetical protein B5808_18070 [Cnuibacter physcomitrellae]GGI39130.1 3-oxoadipate enol-lactone hydrolase [Cnuibacter physcomitrellae]
MQQRAHHSPLPSLSVTESAPEIAYRLRPSTDAAAEVVVLLHGVGSSSATWAELAPLVDERYALLMPDYRGHGDSAKPEPPYRVEDFVADLLRLTAELGIRRFHLVGFSIGAVFGQALALAAPDAVASLVLLNSIADRTEAEQERALERLEVIRTGDLEQIAASSAERWFTQGFRDEHPELVSAETTIVAANEPGPYAAAYEVLATTDLIDSVDGIRCPVLLVTGEDDRGSTPRMSHAIHDRLPAADLVVVPGLRHYLHIEAAPLIAELINDFLVRHPLDSADARPENTPTIHQNHAPEGEPAS